MSGLSGSYGRSTAPTGGKVTVLQQVSVRVVTVGPHGRALLQRREVAPSEDGEFRERDQLGSILGCRHLWQLLSQGVGLSRPSGDGPTRPSASARA
jgi:hypothetical protein